MKLSEAIAKGKGQVVPDDNCEIVTSVTPLSGCAMAAILVGAVGKKTFIELYNEDTEDYGGLYAKFHEIFPEIDCLELTSLFDIKHMSFDEIEQYYREKGL